MLLSKHDRSAMLWCRAKCSRLSTANMPGRSVKSFGAVIGIFAPAASKTANKGSVASTTRAANTASLKCSPSTAAASLPVRRARSWMRSSFATTASRSSWGHSTAVGSMHRDNQAQSRVPIALTAELLAPSARTCRRFSLGGWAAASSDITTSHHNHSQPWSYYRTFHGKS